MTPPMTPSAEVMPVVDFERAKATSKFATEYGISSMSDEDFLVIARAFLSTLQRAEKAEARETTASQLWERMFKEAMDRAEVAEARAKNLVKYARHTPECQRDMRLSGSTICQCGLSDLIGAS